MSASDRGFERRLRTAVADEKRQSTLETQCSTAEKSPGSKRHRQTCQGGRVHG